MLEVRVGREQDRTDRQVTPLIPETKQQRARQPTPGRISRDDDVALLERFVHRHRVVDCFGKPVFGSQPIVRNERLRSQCPREATRELAMRRRTASDIRSPVQIQQREVVVEAGPSHPLPWYPTDFTRLHLHQRSQRTGHWWVQAVFENSSIRSARLEDRPECDNS